jgi:hypothetical protein
MKGPAASIAVISYSWNASPPVSCNSASIVSGSYVRNASPRRSRYAAMALLTLSPIRPSTTPGDAPTRDKRICIFATSSLAPANEARGVEIDGGCVPGSISITLPGWVRPVGSSPETLAVV